jgi:hypothetical protein
MEKNNFELVLQTVSAGLVGKIMADAELNEDAAMEKLYSSALYSALEKEETKVWHYSVPMLYELYKQEIITGRLTLPEY